MSNPAPSPFDTCLDLPIFDQGFKANPYPLYDTLRGSGGVSPVRLPSGVEAWVVTAYSTARSLLGDKRLSKQPACAGDRSAGASPDRPPAAHPLFDHLLTTDPPCHTLLRGVLARSFSSRRVTELRPRVEAIASMLLDAMAPRGEADLITAFATPLPFAVVCELVGIPAGDRAAVQQTLQDLEVADLDDPERVPVIAQALSEYFAELASHKRAGHDDDLLGALVAASDRGEFAPERLPAFAFLLLAAGHETTANLIGNGVFTLLGDPPTWHRLCAEPSSVGRTVEELLRLQSPLEMATARYASEDIVIGGHRIRAGDTVFVGLAAANHDPDRFTQPDRLDPLRREASTHLAFGHGIHTCIGAGLARLEGEIALRELSRRFPDLRLAAPSADCTWKPGLITRGLRALPVCFEPRAATGVRG